MTLGLLGGEVTDPFLCSRAGCSETADRALRWQNPKIHRGDRFKTWLACPKHFDYLYGFLEARGFPITVVTTDELASEGAEG